MLRQYIQVYMSTHMYKDQSSQTACVKMYRTVLKLRLSILVSDRNLV